MSKIKAVVFDIDGTLLDTSEFILQAYEHVLSKNGLQTRTREDIASQIGKKIEDCYAFLAPGTAPQQLIDDHNAFQMANLALVKAFDFVESVIDDLRKQDVKIGLWTGRRHNVIDSINHTGLDIKMFDCIIDASMTPIGKPDPSGLLLTLSRLNSMPVQAVMVGDAAFDILAGKAAEVALTIGLTHGFGTRSELEAANPDFILDSLETLPNIIRSHNES